MVTGFLIDQIVNKTEKLDVNQEVRKAKEKDKILNDSSLTNDEKMNIVKDIDSKYINSFLLNIVEEPELNLFPVSQWEMLKSLLSYNNQIKENTLIITTHRPYIINYLTLTIEANNLKKKINTQQLQDKLNKIVPSNVTFEAKDLVIYELNERTGKIKRLHDYNGLPSDENYLNQNLAHTNDLFSQLLDIEDLCQ